MDLSDDRVVRGLKQRPVLQRWPGRYIHVQVVPGLPAVLPAGGASSSLIDQIVREGARRMLAAALQAEVAAYTEQFADVRGEDGRRMVVRNGTAQPRTVLTSAGAVEVTAPRVNDKRAARAQVSGCGSARRSCRRGCVRPRRSARCCRCCICIDCPLVTSCPRWASSSVRMPGSRRPQ